MVSIRLQRHGRKRRPYYHIVAADQRAPRDGRIIERIGSYSPTDSPILREVDTERALYWLKNGAKPSDTVRSILKQEGILYRLHLLNWGKTEEEIDAALEAWKSGKSQEADKTVRSLKKEVLKKEEEAFRAAQTEAEKAAAEAAAEEAEKAKKAEEAASAEAEAASEAEASVETAEESIESEDK